MVPTVGNVGGVLGVPAGSPPPPFPNPCSPLTWSRRKYPGVKRLGRIIMAWRGAAGSDPTGQQQGGPRHPAPNPKTPPPQYPDHEAGSASVTHPPAGSAVPSERAARTRQTPSSCQPRSAPAAPPSAHAGAGGRRALRRWRGGQGRFWGGGGEGRRAGLSTSAGLCVGCSLPQFPHLQRKRWELCLGGGGGGREWSDTPPPKSLGW